MASSEPTLEVINLCKRYSDFALGPVDFKLEPGTVHGLIGANGAGKTTLYRCLMGTVRKDQGIIKLNGQPIGGDSGRWKQAIGYVGDYTPLYENWSGARNLKAFARFYYHYDEELVQSLASKFDLNLDQIVHTYSTGQRTKLAIIHALAHGANFLLLDEPTSGLDPISRDTFAEVLHEQMGAQELTVLYATHYVTEIEQFADQLLIINKGRILAHKVKDDLAQHWRKMTFRSDRDLGELPNQIAIKVFSNDKSTDEKPNFTKEYEMISNNHESTRMFLEHAGAEAIQSSRLSIEQICVQILKTQAGSKS
ncbi:MAG: ABC transporter ATP-binding protein [Pseudomonadota bacterium]